jgi:hypothetical protein
VGSRTDSGGVAAIALGRALAIAVGAVAAVRGPRPIHTTGLLLTGRLRWYGPTAARSGIGWIDERPRGEVRVTARLSRGAALPVALPDIVGLAIRPGAGEGDGDLLVSSTGLGVPGRFLLRPRWTPARAVLSTLMPYRGADGPVLVAARSTAPGVLPLHLESVREVLRRRPWRLELMFASPLGRWHRFAELELTPAAGAIDAETPRFDPVLRPPRGAGTYSWTRALREPAYLVARDRGRPPRR